MQTAGTAASRTSRLAAFLLLVFGRFLDRRRSLLFGLLFSRLGDNGRCRDGRDGEVAIGNGRPHALRQVEIAGVNGFADVAAGEVDHELLGDVVDRAGHLDLVADDVQHAAALEPRTVLLVDEPHGDPQRQRGTLRDAEKIDVYREVANRIELDVAGNDARLLAADVDHVERRQEASALQVPQQRLPRKRDRLRRLAVAVDDTGHEALAPDCAGGPLADLVARLGADFLYFGHVSCSPWMSPAGGCPPVPRLLQGCRRGIGGAYTGGPAETQCGLTRTACARRLPAVPCLSGTGSIPIPRARCGRWPRRSAALS